ncbi:MAG TPA: hypothetical protein VIK65_01995, partial [Candidatus Limnocylindrales bacterium]
MALAVAPPSVILDNRSNCAAAPISSGCGGRTPSRSSMTQLDIFRLDGRVALIPGGGGAIGAAVA